MVRPSRFAVTAALFAVVLGAGCTEPTAPDVERRDLFGGSPSSTLVSCPTGVTESTTGLISAVLGGTLSVGGHSVTIPGGALLSDAQVTLTVPASKYVEVELEVEGRDHFLFELPVIVTIDYSRCTRSNILFKPLTVWYIDSERDALIENMGGVDDKLLRRITFTTDHFSSYAVAE